MTTAISFFQSLFMKKEESYHICGIDVKFQKENKDNNFFVYKVPEKPPSNIALKAIDKFSKQLESIENYFSKLSQRNLHNFVHEMSHALTAKFLIKDSSPKVTIFLEDGYAGGVTESKPSQDSWRNSLVKAAGPLGNVVFCNMKIGAALLLKNYIPYPLRLFIGIEAITHVANEIVYAISCVKDRTGGDFKCIKDNSKNHLMIASVALAAVSSLAAFGSMKLLE